MKNFNQVFPQNDFEDLIASEKKIQDHQQNEEVQKLKSIQLDDSQDKPNNKKFSSLFQQGKKQSSLSPQKELINTMRESTSPQKAGALGKLQNLSESFAKSKLNLIISLGLYYFDVYTDFNLAVKLLEQNHPWWAGLSFFFTFFSLVSSMGIYILNEKNRTWKTYFLAITQIYIPYEFYIELQTDSKYTLKSNAIKKLEVYFESLPQLLLQLYIYFFLLFYDGTNTTFAEDQAIQSLKTEFESSPALFLSIASSFVSATLEFYKEESMEISYDPVYTICCYIRKINVNPLEYIILIFIMADCCLNVVSFSAFGAITSKQGGIFFIMGGELLLTYIICLIDYDDHLVHTSRDVRIKNKYFGYFYISIMYIFHIPWKKEYQHTLYFIIILKSFKGLSVSICLYLLEGKQQQYFSHVMISILGFWLILFILLIFITKYKHQSVLKIFEQIKDNQTEEHINLRGAYFGKQGCQALAESLVYNSSIKTLDLKSNYIKDQEVKLISIALWANSYIQRVILSINIIGDEGAKEIANMLRKNRTISNLNLFHNLIEEKGAKDLSNALKFNQTLKILNLGINMIGNQGAKELAEALKENSCLEDVVLRENEIENSGAIALAEALKENSTLKSLDLIQNKITDQGAEAFLEALDTNTSLEELSLQDNQISQEKKRLFMKKNLITFYMKKNDSKEFTEGQQLIAIVSQDENSASHLNQMCPSEVNQIKKEKYLVDNLE